MRVQRTTAFLLFRSLYKYINNLSLLKFLKNFNKKNFIAERSVAKTFFSGWPETPDKVERTRFRPGIRAEI